MWVLASTWLTSSETQSVVRFQRLYPLTDEVHHATLDAVHRTGDLDRSFLFQIRQYRASPPNVFDCQFDIGSGDSVDVSRILAGLLAFKLGFRNGRFDPRQQSREIA